MHRAAHKSPGTQPAMRRAATETPPLAAEYTIKEAVGGISWPTGAVAIFTAAEKPLSYPCSSSRGSMTPPIAVAAAMPEPDMEPNMALPAMLVMATPQPINQIAPCPSSERVASLSPFIRVTLKYFCFILATTRYLPSTGKKVNVPLDSFLK